LRLTNIQTAKNRILLGRSWNGCLFGRHGSDMRILLIFLFLAAPSFAGTVTTECSDTNPACEGFYNPNTRERITPDTRPGQWEPEPRENPQFPEDPHWDPEREDENFYAGYKRKPEPTPSPEYDSIKLRREIEKAIKDYEESDGFTSRAGLVLDIERIFIKWREKEKSK
jgi:hypothetical protein